VYGEWVLRLLSIWSNDSRLVTISISFQPSPPASLTISVKLTRPGLPVEFGEDEPICMVVPQRRGELESFRPRVSNLVRAPGLARSYARWSFGRSRFLRELQEAGSRAQQRGWQRDYMLGVLPDGRRAPEHQRKLNLEPFVSEPEND
jgi:hypothetical protein